MLSDRLVASPFVWFVGTLVTTMCLLPSIIASVIGKDQISTLTTCTIAVVTTLFYFKEVIVITWVLGAIMMLFLKKWKVSAIMVVASLICLYLLIVLGGFILHAKVVKNVTSPMWGLLMSVYFGDATTLIILSYLLPGIVAFKRERKSRRKILVSNLLLGWVPGMWPLLLFISWKEQASKPE